MLTIKVETSDRLDVVLNDEAAWPLDGDIKMEVEDCSDDDMDWSVKTCALDDPNSYEELKKKGIFTCEMCPRMFLNRFKLMQHKVSHLKVKLSSSQIYECYHCSVIYVKKTSLAKHIRYKHENPNRSDLPEKMRDCKICKKTFKYRHWHEHMRNVHDPKALWSCNLCSKKFKCERYLIRHHLYVHEDRKPEWMHKKREKHVSGVLECSECPKTFKTDDCLRLHVKYVHSKKGSVKCKFCSSVMKCENYLLKHMKRFHSADGREHSCKTCRKIFQSSEYLNRHIRSVHNLKKLEKPKEVALQIAVTKKITCVRNTINAKMLETGGERRSFEKAFQCSECMKTFTIKSRLNRHIKNIHSEIGVYTCKICSVVMKCERYLQNHIRKVHFKDGLIHSCAVCSKNFGSAHYVKAHMRRVHHIGKRKPKEITPEPAVTKEISPNVSFTHSKLESAAAEEIARDVSFDDSKHERNGVRMEALLKKEEIQFEENGVFIDLRSGPVTSFIEFPLEWKDL